MPSLSKGMQGFMASLGPEAARAMRVQQIRDRYKAAVQRAWSDSPEAARLVLAHTNGMYVAKDERRRTGPDKHKDRIVFDVYLDDAVVRTEFDARQQMLALALRQEGMSFDELRILHAKGDMRHRHAFPEVLEGEGIGAASAVHADDASMRAFTVDDEVRQLDALKRAFCLAFEDTEDAWAVLAQVKAASLDPVRVSDDRRWKIPVVWCHLYVDDVPAMEAVLARHGEAVMSQARRVGLGVRSIKVHRATPAMRGQCAFRRVGHSVPLRLQPSWATGSSSAVPSSR